MSWCSGDLIRYMSNRPDFYGGRWKYVHSADFCFLAKCFTDSVLTHLSLSSVSRLPFTHILFTGKGDPSGVSVDSDFCFSSEQITAIMNRICCFDCDDRINPILSDYISFQIEMYLLYDCSIYKDWISEFRKNFLISNNQERS